MPGPNEAPQIFCRYTAKITQVVTALLVEQCLNNTVIMAEQCCWTNNVVHYCFNNVVQHWWSNNGCSRLLKQEKTILIEQACSLLLSFFVWCLRVDACLSAGYPWWLWRILVDNFVVESYFCRCGGIFCVDFWTELSVLMISCNDFRNSHDSII